MENGFHPVNYLFDLHDQFRSYPNGVVRITKHIEGTAFFPGGTGLWKTLPNKPFPPMPIGGVMIVGHNFDSEAGFNRSFNHGGENLEGPTWKNLLDFLMNVVRRRYRNLEGEMAEQALVKDAIAAQVGSLV